MFLKGLRIIFFFCTLAVAAQQPLTKSFDIRTESTRPRIQKLLLDHNGAIWTGTDRGIFIFDGIIFKKIFNPDSGNAFVTALFEDSESTIWAGFGDGKIISIKNQKIFPLAVSDSLPEVAISGFAETGNRIYISTKGQGIYSIHEKRLIKINQDDGLSDDYCYSMIRLRDGRLCTGTDAGLNFITSSKDKIVISEFGTSDGLPDDIVRCLVAENNFIWIGMQENGIAKFDCSTNKLVTTGIKGKWEYGQVNNILIVGNELWIATEERGIVVVDKEGRINNLQIGIEKHIKANDLLLDKENNVWLSESIHLYRTSGNKITFMSSLAGKELTFIHCIIADKKGNIWFTPDQQLGNIYMGEDGKYKYKEYHVLDKFVDIVALHFDTFGYLWIGTLGSGVYRFNPLTGNVRKIEETYNTADASVLSINGSGDQVWVAGFNSVMKFIIRSKGNSDNAVIEKVPAFKENLLLNDYVYSVFVDSKGKTWYGTDGSGVYSYDGNKLKNYPVADNVVHSFTEDKRGRIWYSTADAGLEYIDIDGSIKKFQTKDGLSDPSATSILCTKTGSIIIVHANGFDVLYPDNGAVIYHSSEEGLADINPDLNSITSSPDSSIWIGTERGIIHYVPAYEMKLQRPTIVLQSVSDFLDLIEMKKTIFNSDENNFQFDYSGIWYSDPQRINYSFILDGYSTKWETTKDHTVTFPKLPPGKYTFRVKASLTENFDHSESDSYSFKILPPIWQRLWFRIMTAGIIALIIFIIIRRREERLRKFDKIQKEKIEFQFETLKSQVNPHFLFNSFNTLISIIENSPKNALEYVEKLSDFFRNIVTFRDKNLILLSEELNLLENFIFIQKKRFGENLRLENSLEENIKMQRCIPPLTLQLLAENAMKHNAVSRETPLIISIRSTNDTLTFSNNINPKISREDSTGLGLENIRNRYALLTKEKVEVKIENDNFIVIIPLINLKHENSDSRR